MNMNKYRSASTMGLIVEPKLKLNPNDIPTNIATNIPECKSRLEFSQDEAFLRFFLDNAYHEFGHFDAYQK